MTKQTITLAHGNGGQLMQELLRTTVIPGVSGDASLSDGAVLPVGNQEIVFSTDSFTVQPLFFPGGDIGTLAVSGTVNDVAAMGAKPLYLSCGAIIEEGFPLADLQRILASMQRVATEQGVRIVTGDTK
ncbi:MAG TPA: AIR synthase related protein, partial [bacterium]|nr:AIR synthase related protein [bacterium]